GILLHDIGKGSKEDHSVVGARVAERLSRQRGFSDPEKNLLIFLVRYHLLMSHIAFRRDLADDKVILLFARQVARPEVLKKLFVLTYADIRAVGPDTWTEWKKNLLTELFCRTMAELTGTRVAFSVEERIQRLKTEIDEKVCLLFPPGWIDEMLNDVESRYLLVTPPDRIIHHLQRIYQLTQGGKVLVDSTSDALLTEFTIYTYDDVTPGLFSKAAGVLAAVGYNILGAQVYTSRRGIVVDTFQAQDPFPEEDSAVARREAVQELIRKVLTHEITVENLFEKKSFLRPAPKIISQEPTVVEIDNESSDGCTIIDIFAPDKQGLLYVITKSIHDLGLSVHSSKIATKVDQIVDVFYVKNRQGNKVTDPDQVQEIRQRLIKAIESY
ncbi:MAG: HD domain-containing protein, partial [Nitrospirae bacterium]|nr:HD domain-containing protein [Nitrospirota bacterium]